VKAGPGQARVVAIGDTYFLEGTVESRADKARAEKITRAVLAEASPGR
jgi:osmotically-inducible protein OsmY